MRPTGLALGMGLMFALACAGGEPPAPVIVAPPPVAVAPVVAVAPPAPDTPATVAPKASTSTAPKAESGGGCCKTEGDWGEQWGLTLSQADCASDRYQGVWVSGKECEKVCCNTNDETVGWRARGSCRQFGMWSSSTVDAGQCKGLGLEDSKVVGSPGGGEVEPVVEDELQLDDLDLPVRPATTARPRPSSSGVTKSRPK